MDEKLKEFVWNLTFPIGKFETETKMEKLLIDSNLALAQAVYDFAEAETEKRVLEELTVYLLEEKEKHHPTREVNLRAGLQLAVFMLNQRLARIGGEKNGKD